MSLPEDGLSARLERNAMLEEALQTTRKDTIDRREERQCSEVGAEVQEEVRRLAEAVLGSDVMDDDDAVELGMDLRRSVGVFEEDVSEKKNVEKTSEAAGEKEKAEEEDVVEVEESEGTMLGRGLGTAAAARLHRARASALDKQLQVLEDRNREQAREILELKASLKESVSKQEKLKKSSKTTDVACEKYRNQAQEADAKCESLSRELQAARHELAERAKEMKKMEANEKARAVRLQRSLEESASYRTQLDGMKQREKDNKENVKHGNNKLVSEVRKLEKQKAELLRAFKQQMRLIDVLKKQRVHMEAAQLLNFTEQEFRKALEDS